MAETRASHPGRSSPALRAILDRSQEAGGGASSPRSEIVASWRRCARAGLRPDRFDVPYDADVDDRGRLCWAAESVIDSVGNDLDGTGIGLLLTDQRARVLARRAGDRAPVSLLDRVRRPGQMQQRGQCLATGHHSPGRASPADVGRGCTYHGQEIDPDEHVRFSLLLDIDGASADSQPLCRSQRCGRVGEPDQHDERIGRAIGLIGGGVLAGTVVGVGAVAGHAPVWPDLIEVGGVHVQAAEQLEEHGDGPLTRQLRLGYTANSPRCHRGPLSWSP
jgi:hypothetical protein